MVATALKVAEKHVTRVCREYLELRGWSAVRLNAGAFTRPGLPDYIFLDYQRPAILWIEFKAPGGRPSRVQLEVHAEIRRRGGMVWLIDSYEALVDAYEAAFGVEGQGRLAL